MTRDTKFIIVIASLIVGLIAAIVAPFVADLHVYKVKSGYSGNEFWLTYSRQPSEEELLDAVIYREPLIENSSGTMTAWRKAQAEGNRLFIKKDADVSILVMAYDASHNPDPVFPDGGSNLFEDLIPGAKGLVKGVWLTEPSTRMKYPAALVGMAYSVGSFLLFAIGSLCTIAIVLLLFALVRWLWYFLLRRVAEFSSAVRGKDH